MVFKIVGADENGLFPTRVMNMLRKPAGTRVALLGDSITDFNFDYSNYPTTVQTHSRGFFIWANILLRQRFSIVGPSNTDGAYGGPGLTAATMLTNGDTAAAAASATDIVIILAGTNDLADGANYTAAQITANLQAMWAAQLNAGKRVVACTIMPRNNSDTAAVTQKLRDTNRLIRRAAANTPGVTLCDWYGVTLDISTGLAKSGTYYIDGIHPNSQGASRLGAQLASVLDRAFPLNNEDLPFDNADTNNMVSNGFQVGTSGSATGGSAGSGTVATDWTLYAYGSGGNTVASKVARSDLQAGEWQQLVSPSGANYSYQIYMGIGGTRQPAIGDLVYATAEFETDAANWGMGQLGLTIEFNGSSNASRGPTYAETLVLQRPPSGILRTPAIPVPSGATLLKVNINANGPGTLRVGRTQLTKV